MNKNLFFLFLLSLFFISCEGEESKIKQQSATTPSIVLDDQKNIDSEINEEQELIEQMQITKEDLIELDISEEEALEIIAESNLSNDDNSYRFNKVVGKCFNKKFEEGHNDKIEECGDVRGQQIEAKELHAKNLYGLNIEDTHVNKGRVKYRKIAKEEHKYNEQTVFEGQKEPFKKLVKAHTNAYKKQIKLIKANMIKIQKLRVKVGNLMIKYDKHENEKKKDKILKRIVKIKNFIHKRNKLTLIAANKKNRHKEFAIRTDDMITE